MIVSLTEIVRPQQDEIKYFEPNTSAFVKNNPLGKGTLFIALNRLSWLAENGQGFSLEYPDISLHAVSRDLNTFPDECLYLMVEDQAESASESDDEESRVGEIRFVPDEKTNLEQMFRAMSECQILHPDPNDSISEDDEEDDNQNEGAFEDADEAQSSFSATGVVYNVARAERVLGVPDSDVAINDERNGTCEDGEAMDTADQFEDAEPDH